MVFTNKHFIIAMIVAPILAILAWFATGEFAGEVPQESQPGQSYPLVEKSSCRYPSGACELENEDFRLTLSPRQGESGAELVLLSSHPLDGVVLGVGDIEQQVEPAAMRATDGQGLEWRLLLDRIPAPTERIRLVAMAGGSSYFADAATLFLQPDDN